MIFMAKVCPKAINFATAESIHQLLALRPHPTVQCAMCMSFIYVGVALACENTCIGLLHWNIKDCVCLKRASEPLSGFLGTSIALCVCLFGAFVLYWRR